MLYFRANFEKNKVQELLSRKDLWIYFKEILPINYYIFRNIQIPSELINLMINQTPLSFKIIEGTLLYLKFLEKILICINEHIDIIYEVCTKEKKLIKMNDLTDPKKEDDIEKILIEIEKLVNYELKKQKFVLFEEGFFNNYIRLYFERDLKKLLLIKKVILLCNKIDNKKLNPDYERKIHKTGLEMIRKGELKNEELLDFIENDDIYFIENKKDYLDFYARPLDIFKGFDLENVNEKFYEKWNKVNIFKKYSFSYKHKAEEAMIDKINHMKDFGKLLKLFYFENEELCNKDTIILISNKYKKLIKTYKSETCPNFIKETSLLIYMLDKKTFTGKFFMENTIEKDFRSPEIINDIYLYLSSNYKDISNKLIEHITNYFIRIIKNKNAVPKVEKILEVIINKIDNYVIKEEELFNEDKQIDSFILLERIQKENMTDKYPAIKETSYILSTINSTNKISNNIKTGELKYSLINSWYQKPQKYKILIERLNILFFQNENEVKNCMEIIKKYITKISEITEYIQKLYAILKAFFELSHKNDIEFLENLEKEIKDGMLNIIDKKKIIDKINNIYKIIPDLEIIFQLKSSKIFLGLFNNKKAIKKYEKDLDILKEAKIDYNSLKILFEEDWIVKMDIIFIKDFRKILIEIDDDKIENELNFMITYFKINNFNLLNIQKLKEEIIKFKTQTIFFGISKYFFSFISDKKEELKKNYNEELK